MGCTLTLKDVRHIPDLRLNLIFVHMLDKDGYDHFISSGNWKLTKGPFALARGRLCCSLYKTQVKVCRGQLNAVDDDTSLDLWHKRLAHMSEKGLQLLAKQSLIVMTKKKKKNLQTLVTIAYLERKIEYHSKRTPLKIWRNWN